MVHKSGQFLGNEIADAVIKPNDDKIVKPDEDPKNVEEIIISPEKNRWSIKQIEKSTIKMEHYKKSKLLNDSTVSQFVTKNRSK